MTHGESRESGALHVEMSLDQGGGGGEGADASSGWWDGVGSMGCLMEGKGGAGAGTGGRERENRKSRAEVSVVGAAVSSGVVGSESERIVGEALSGGVGGEEREGRGIRQCEVGLPEGWEARYRARDSYLYYVDHNMRVMYVGTYSHIHTHTHTHTGAPSAETNAHRLLAPDPWGRGTRTHTCSQTRHWRRPREPQQGAQVHMQPPGYN